MERLHVQREHHLELLLLGSRLGIHQVGLQGGTHLQARQERRARVAAKEWRLLLLLEAVHLHAGCGLLGEGDAGLSVRLSGDEILLKHHIIIPEWIEWLSHVIELILVELRHAGKSKVVEVSNWI